LREDGVRKPSVSTAWPTGRGTIANVLRARPGYHPLPRPSRRRRRTPPVPGGIGSALGFLAGTAATLLGAAVGARDHPVLGLALLGCVALTVAAVTSAAGALAGAAQCWALWDGFLVN